jgi:hypothetical protein
LIALPLKILFSCHNSKKPNKINNIRQVDVFLHYCSKSPKVLPFLTDKYYMGNVFQHKGEQSMNISQGQREALKIVHRILLRDSGFAVHCSIGTWYFSDIGQARAEKAKLVSACNVDTEILTIDSPVFDCLDSEFIRLCKETAAKPFPLSKRKNNLFKKS